MERIDNLDLDQLRALHAAAKITRLIPNGAAFTDDGKHCGRFFETQRISFALASRRAEYFAAIHNAFPAIADRLEAAERDLKTVKASNRLQAQAIASLEAALGNELGLNASQSAVQWIAALKRSCKARALREAAERIDTMPDRMPNAFGGISHYDAMREVLMMAERMEKQ